MTTVEAPPRRRGVPELLHDVPFRRYWLGQTISMFGDQVSSLVIPLIAVLVLGADAGQMGLLTAAGLVPSLLFSLHAGAWVDRHAKRRYVMIGADLGRSVLLLSIPIAYAFGVLSFAQLYVVAFGAGVLSVLFEVSHPTLFVSLVSKDRYVEGNSLVNGSRAMSFVAGPGIGGLIVAILAAPIALVLDAFSYLASAAFLAKIAPVEPAAATAEESGVSTGVKFIVRSVELRSALAATATLNLFNYMFAALFVLFATTELGLSPGLLGALLGAGAVGGIIGAIFTGRIVTKLGIGRATVFSFILFPAPLILIPAASGPTPVIAGLVLVAECLSAAGVMVLDIAVGSLFAAIIPDAMRSRVSGAYRMVNYGVRPIGSVIGGTLGLAIGLRPTLWIATVGALLSVLWLVRSPIASMKELPELD